MLMALVRGKLSSEQENMEDILTSNVFGLLQYCSPASGCLPFLRLARTTEGMRPLEHLPDGTRVKYEFWPVWQALTGKCEPDVVLRLRAPDDSRTIVAIEAKFRSDKSSEATDATSTLVGDQLAREWENLADHATKEGSGSCLVYVTADMSIPSASIEASRVEHRAKRGTDPLIAWVSWRHLEWVIRSSDVRMLRDLAPMLDRLNLTFFHGGPGRGRSPC